MRSRLTPTCRKLTLLLVIIAITGSAISPGGSRNSSKLKRAFRITLISPDAIALIQRRLGHWEEAIDRFRRVVELDPRNTNAYNILAVTYIALRRFPEALATLDRVLAWEPTNADALRLKASALWATGDLQAVEPLLGNPGIDPGLRGVQALFQRRYAAAIEIFSSEVAAKTKRGEPSVDEKSYLGLSQQRAGDVAAARATYQSVVQDIQRDLEKTAPDSNAAAETHAALGLAYAGLGEAASAIAEGQKAMAMCPTSKDPFEGPADRGEYGGHLRAAGRCRSRDSHSQAAAADTVWRCNYSGAAATRSGVGSNPQRSALSGIGRRKEAVNLKNFAAEVSGGNVYKGAVAYAGTSCLSYHSFSVFLVQDQRPSGSTKTVLRFVSPVVSPGQREMGRFLMTWDDEASSASY